MQEETFVADVPQRLPGKNKNYADEKLSRSKDIKPGRSRGPGFFLLRCVMCDLIRREDAIEALKKYEELESNNFTDTSPISMMTVATIANCIEEIVNLPSAEAERKKGK